MLIERVDANEYTQRYRWDKLGRLIGLENENESKATFLYDPVGRLLQETGFDGLVTRYQYDQYSGRLGVLPRFPDALPDPLALVDSYIADEVDQDACQALARQWQAKLAGGHAVKHFHSEQARGFPDVRHQ